MTGYTKNRSSRDIDPSLLAPLWGSLWAPALGTWLLIPEIISVHQIRPANTAQWTVLLVSLIAILAVMGSFLGFVGGLLLALLEEVTIRRFRDRMWAYALLTSILVVAGYVVEDFAVEFVTYQSTQTRSLYSDEVKVLVLFACGIFLSAAIAYRLVARARIRPSPVLLAIGLMTTTVAGAFAAVARTSAAQLPNADVEPLVKNGASLSTAPLLFIGIDGATWRVLDPAIRSGKAPTFRSIQDRGTSGDIEALWPPYWSGAAWASILTGLPQETTGIYEDLAATAPGLPPFQVPLFPSLKLNAIYAARHFLKESGAISFVPPPRALLRGRPVWELLHDGGVNSAVIRFRFTYPPTGQADVVVSDWVGSDSWEQMGVQHRTTTDAVAPTELSDELLAPFRVRTRDEKLFRTLIPDPSPERPADAVVDPFEYLRASADVDERTFDVSMTVLRRNPAQPFLAIYIDGLDSAEHAFWQYRFPGDYADPPAADDVKRFAPVIDRYVQFIDERLHELLALFRQEPNIVIVSDHGHGASQVLAGWRGWHTKDGIFLAAGPSVPKTSHRVPVSYYDIVPTLISLEGFDKPKVLRGKALFKATEQVFTPATRSH